MSAPAVKPRDWSLCSGERQTSPHWPDANAAHRARYAWAASLAGNREHQRGADVFCATGYGTDFLATHTGARMLGLDGSPEAIALAARTHPTHAFSVARWPCAMPVEAVRFIVCLESLEHVEDDAGFARALADMLVWGGDLYLSVPHETRISCAEFGNRFHVRHYTRDGLDAVLTAAGFTIIARYGQTIHRYVESAYGVRRQGRVPDGEQSVFPDDGRVEPCALLIHARKVP